MQQGQDFGSRIEGMVNDALAGVLAQTRTQLQQEMMRLEHERQGLQAALAAAPNRPARLGIQNELSRVEEELAKVRSGLDKIERQLNTRDGPRETFAETGVTPRLPAPPADNFDPAPMVIAVVSIVLIGFPIALTLARFIWKRSTHAPAPPMTAAQAQRFDRLEQSVDAIAIEVERISENQRYLTKLLAEPKKQGIGVGQ